MTIDLEERLSAYRGPLEDAIESHRHHPASAGEHRRWSILAPLIGAIAVSTIVVVVGVDRDATAPAPAPADTVQAPVAPTTAQPTGSPATVTSVPTSPPERDATFPAVAPVTDATPAPANGAPPAPPPILAIGDSVMLGAADELAARGDVVSVEASRQMRSMVPVVQQLRDSGQLGDTVIVHLGNNGPLDDETLSAFFGAFSGVRRVIALTDHGPSEFIATNNAKLLALPAQFPNVEVLYWDELANECPGNCFYDDGVHLRQDGQDYYTALIASLVGI